MTDDLPRANGVPDLEAMIILSYVKRNPGLLKSQITFDTREILNKQKEEGLFLRYIDSLTNVQYLVKYSYKMYITPLGINRFKELKQRNAYALQLLALNDI